MEFSLPQRIVTMGGWRMAEQSPMESRVLPLSNSLIQKNWEYISGPLVSWANEMFKVF